MPGIAGWIPVGHGPPLAAALSQLRDSCGHEPGDTWTEVTGSKASVAISAHAARPDETFIQRSADDQIVLAFSGELFEGSPDDIVASYLRDGESALDRLDGSFVLYLADGRTGSTILATDYLGSRPMYYAEGHGGFAFGPELGTLTGFLGGGSPIDRNSAVAFLIHGHLLGEQTWIRGVHAVPPATILRIEKDGSTSLRSYFKLGPAGAAVRDESSEACSRLLADRLRAAVERRFAGGDGLVLPLSGGIDSRGILGCLLEIGVSNLRTVTWGTENRTIGSDAWVASELADRFGTNHTFLRRESINLRGNVREMVRRIDATTDDPAMHPYELQLMRTIRDELGGTRLMRGDECFGFGGPAVSDQEAFARVGLSQLSATREVQQLLHRDRLDASLESSRELLYGIAAGCRVSDFTDRKDTYYATQRLRHYLNRSSYYKLSVLNLQNPWLDRQLLEFVWSLPTSCRVDKQLFMSTLEAMYPTLMAEPVASVNSLEDWHEEIRHGSELRDYLHDRLVIGAESLGALLDPESVSRFASNVLSDQQGDPGPAGSLDGLKRLARRVLPARAYSGLKTRFLEKGFHRPVRPAVVALRLLILSEWVERVGEFDHN